MTYQYKREPLSIEEADRLRDHDHLSATEIYLNMSPQQVLEELVTLHRCFQWK